VCVCVRVLCVCVCVCVGVFVFVCVYMCVATRGMISDPFKLILVLQTKIDAKQTRD